MGFWSRLFGRKAAPGVAQVALNDLFGSWYGRSTRSGVGVTTQTAMMVPVVLCAARVIAEGIAQCPVVIKRQRLVGDRMFSTPAYDHWSWPLLRKRPNEWMTGYEFREALTLHAVLNGNGYAYISRGLEDRPAALLPIPSDMCQVEQLTDYTVQYRIADGKQLIGIVPKRDMLHIHGPSWNQIGGVNVVQLAAEAIGLAQALQDQQATLAGNGGRPSGVLANKSPLGEEAKKALREAWIARFGPGGTGGIAILDGEWTYSSLAMTGVDAQHIETREHQIAEVARAFRVFPLMLMSKVADNSAYASAEQFFIAHVKHTLEPWIRRWTEAIERDILDDDELDCELDTTRLESGTMNDRGNFYAKALGSGGSPAWLTPNDIRAREGYNPHEDGDDLAQPAGAAPADQGKPAE